MNKEQFLEYVRHFCESNNIQFEIFPGQNAYSKMSDTPCTGFFEANSMIKPILGIAGEILPQTFFEVLAHEFCHANQYLESSPYWIGSRLNEEEVERYSKVLNRDLKGFETGDLFQLWIDREIDLENSVLEDIAKRTTGVEYDCEKRTLELAYKLKLEINPEEYAQKANAYLLTYFYALKTRKWTTPGYPTYLQQPILNLMPKNIDQNFSKNITEEMIHLIDENCVK